MTACWGSHGGACGLLLALLLFTPRVYALRPKVLIRKGHTLDDALFANVSASDVEHNDALRFVEEGVAYMKGLGITLSNDCEKRYGYTFISDQKKHHFRMCKSGARLGNDGRLWGVQRAPSAVSKFRIRTEKKLQARKARLAAAASGKPSGTAATATAAGKRRSVLQHEDSAYVSFETVQKEHGLHDERPWRAKHGWLARGQQRDITWEAADDSSSSSRQLQAASNSSSLMYQILKYVNSKKDEGDGDTSDVYNSDDTDGDMENSELDIDAGAVAGEGTAATNASEVERNAKRDAWQQKWQATFARIIEPDVELPELTAINNNFKSSVGCYLQPSMPRNVGFKDAQLLCLGRNVVLDTCAYYDGQNDGFDVRFPKPKVGALKLGCGIQAALLAARNYTKGYKNRLWWHYAQDHSYDTVRQACAPGSGHVVEHPVAFVLRDRYTHTLHELEMLATIFTSLAVVNLPEVREKGIQIIIADQMPHASYRPTYAAISYPYRLRHLAEAPYPPNTCFRTALFINAFTNSIAFNPNINTSHCFSPIMIGVHRWLRNLHKELDPDYLTRVHHHASETGGIVRRAVVWTSRRNLEALRLTSGSGMTEWQSARMVPNENELVTELQSTILRWNSRSCLLARYYEGDGALAGCRNSSVQFDLVFGEFSDWPYYPDQLMTIYRTGVLIGVHGAALTFITSTTAGESALLELAGLGWEDTQTGNMLNLFPSLAHNMGAYYEQLRYQGPDIDIKITTDALERAMDEVSRRINANQRRMLLEKVEEEKEQQLGFNDQYNFDVMFPRACPTSVPNKLRRYVTNHPVQMNLNVSSNSSGGPG